MDYSCLGGSIVKVLLERMADRCLRAVCVYSLLFVIFIVLAPSNCECTEFSYFKLTDIEGSMRLGYSLTETNLEQANGSNTYERRPATEQELTLNTHSYIFHPNLLEMELGCGVRFEQEELENNSGINHAKGTYYDISGRWKFLRNKPYPFSLYYTQRNPTKAVGIADTLSIETQNYGMMFTLRQPIISMPISLRMDHIQNKGESTETIIDDTTDTVSLNVRTNIADYGNGQLGFTSVSQESGSGSRNLPLQASKSDTNSFDWNGRMVFGKERNISLTNYLLVSRNQQSNAADREQETFYNHLSWDFSESLQAYNTYTFSDVIYDENASRNQALVIGATNRLEDSWSYNTFVDATKESSTGFKKSTRGLSGSLNYRNDINERWSSSAGYTALVRLNKQDSKLLHISVLNESHVLSGLMAVSLNQEYVVSGSVVVNNQNHTQTYVENIDYRLSEIGSETRLERLSSGNIADGETVLVDYDYETGGSFDYKQFNQSMNLLYTLDKRYDFAMFYSTDRQTLQSGIPVRTLETVEKYRFGIDAHIPISKIMDYGWKLELERRIDDLHPYTRTSLDLEFNSRLPFFTSFTNLRSGYEHVDNELSIIDIKETYYTAILSARPGWGSIANFELTYRKDTGGEELKSTTYAALGYSWTKGRLGFSVVGKHSKERQGETTRDHTILEASLIRHFR